MSTCNLRTKNKYKYIVKKPHNLKFKKKKTSMNLQSCCLATSVLDNDILVSEVELQLRYDIHLWTNTLGKGMNPLMTPVMG